MLFYPGVGVLWLELAGSRRPGCSSYNCCFNPEQPFGKSPEILRFSMSQVSKILASGRSFTDESRSTPSSTDLKDFELRNSVTLPSAYKEFVELGGLSELGFDQVILAPEEIAASSQHLPDHLLPFAENGCGDAFCWIKENLPDSSVVFWDHESSSESNYLPSFLDCLKRWRRQ